MAVDNVVMPEKVSVGFKGGPTFSTDKVVAVNMQERRLQNLSIARHTYTWNLTNADAFGDTSLMAELRAFWYGRRGDFKAFLMKDWTDYQLVGEQIGIGDGVTVAFQAIKTYPDEINPYVRVIRHLKAGTAVLKLDGVTQVQGVDYTVNSTALFTFSAAPAVGKIPTLDGEFYVPVRFDGDAFDASLPEQTTYVMNVDLKAVEVIP